MKMRPSAGCATLEPRRFKTHLVDNPVLRERTPRRTAVSFAMTKEEREAFLGDVHVGIISIADEERGPLTVPIWYFYEPGGEVRIITAMMSQKGKLLKRAGRFSLCAQSETPPYKYVSVEGPIVAIETADLERDRRPLAHRYLGAARAILISRAHETSLKTCSFACDRSAGSPSTTGNKTSRAERRYG